MDFGVSFVVALYIYQVINLILTSTITSVGSKCSNIAVSQLHTFNYWHILRPVYNARIVVNMHHMGPIKLPEHILDNMIRIFKV